MIGYVSYASTGSWGKLMTVGQGLQAATTVVIAAIATWIAYQQYRTNALKTKLDLFDRRYRVFEEMRDILGAMFTVGADTDRILDFWTKTVETEFLFGSEIEKYRKEISDRATKQSIAKEEVITSLNKDAPSEERTKPVEARRVGVVWATAEMENLPVRFRKYLDVSKL